MMKMKVLGVLLALFLVMPIWYYLLYKILSAIQASELTWFLFWVYLPVSMLVGGIAKLLEMDHE